MAHAAKGNSNWGMAAARIVPLPAMVGGMNSEAEEPEEAEPADSSLEARLEKVSAEPDYERQEIFQYLKEFRSQKKAEPKA